MDQDSSKETTPVSSASEESSGRLLPTTVTNENWRGKNNPQERRRIQNRINQRAFRQRQRAGESSKPYRPRASTSSSSTRRRRDDGSAAASEEESTAAVTATASSSRIPGSSSERSPSRITAVAGAAVAVAAAAAAATDLHRVTEWDELGRLINSNFLSAAATNAQLLGLDRDALRDGIAVKTPRPTNPVIPPALQPVELQFQLAHDPIIDAIPHPQLRHNMLRAIAAGQVDATGFLRDLRASGSLETTYGPGMRAGMVVWSFPEQLASWELSEPFVRRWAFLLLGCDDLLAASNVWRSRRGERPFPLSQE